MKTLKNIEIEQTIIDATLGSHQPFRADIRNVPLGSEILAVSLPPRGGQPILTLLVPAVADVSMISYLIAKEGEQVWDNPRPRLLGQIWVGEVLLSFFPFYP